MLAPDITLPQAFDWPFLGPELSWMEDGFCAQRIHHRARDARLAPKEVPAVLYYGFPGGRSRHVANVAQFSDTGGRSLLPAYGLRHRSG